MPYDPERHHRRSIRLKGYDYTQPGAYFVTICTHDRACLFGEVVDGQMRLNEAGSRRTTMLGRHTEPFPARSIGCIHHHAQPCAWHFGDCPLRR
ncbi:MAG: hypothetical protein KatS3mg077_2491 [Candidatus Binatia bacterium]|nr:MAG: hypothetical protein KatS3mg077_2491 [Candidatus Binatia bacterium]